MPNLFNLSYDFIVLFFCQVRVWCEMTHNGGYTFLHPSEHYNLSDDEKATLLTEIYTLHEDVLLRVRKSDGSQPYAILRQMSSRS